MKRLAIAVACMIPVGLAADEIETITVSATPVSIDESGASVTIISREDLLRKNATDLNDLLREVPGFAVSQEGASGSRTQVRVRGAEGNHVLVLIDGIEANDPAGDSEFDFSNLLTTDIERIEIVRGPQSALWGSDAVAGVVHVITRQSLGSAPPSFTMLVEGGSFGTIRDQASWRYQAGKLSGKVGFGQLETSGTNVARQGDEKDGYKNDTAFATGQLQINEAMALNYTLRYTDSATDYDKSSGGLQADADYEAVIQNLYAGVNLTHQLNERLAHSLHIAQTDTDSLYDEGGPVNREVSGTKTDLHYQLDVLGQIHRLSLLAEYEEEKLEQRGMVSRFGDPNQNRGTDVTSFAAEYRMDLKRLDLSFSARQDANSDFDDATTWRASISWQPREGTAVFSSVGESIKNPTFTERFGFFTNFVGNPDLKPEQSLGYELGIRQGFSDGRGKAALTFFAADLEDEINGFVYDAAAGGFSADNIDGESKRQGVELELSYQATDSFRLAGHYSYVDSTQDDSNGEAHNEIRRPRHSGSLSAIYQFSKGEMEVTATHTGEQEDTVFTFPAQTVTLSGFTLVNLAGHYNLNEKVALTLRLENLLDEDYEQIYSYASPGIGGYLGLRLKL